MSKDLIYLGVDWGEKRIGLALGDSVVKVATPYKVVAVIDDLINEIKAEEVDVLVVGRPHKMKSKDENVDQRYELFIEELKKIFDKKIVLVDERLSSKEADALVGTKKTKAPRDAVAAMLILQSYLNSSHSNG